jgi:MOSC domain-containing protein YiiM
MLRPRSERRLRDTLPQVGRVEWMGRAPVKRASIEEVSEIMLLPETGIEGDHHSTGRRSGSRRQVTLIQAEHLPVIATLSGHEQVLPSLLRRNIVVSGLPLLALVKQRFYLGEALLQTTGLCEPCDQMEAALGPGGFNAMQGHGGITAIVLSGGRVRLGDSVRIHLS